MSLVDVALIENLKNVVWTNSITIARDSDKIDNKEVVNETF